MGYSHKKRCCGMKPENLLLVLTMTSVALGCAVGILIKWSQVEMTPRQLVALKFPGELFLRILQMLVIPLMFSSLVNSVANLETSTAGRLGFLGILYYVITIAIAVATGIVLVLLIKPGSYSPIANEIAEKGDVCKGTIPGDAILDLLRNVFPDNVIKATFTSQKTCIEFTYKANENDTEQQLTYNQVQNLTEKIRAKVKETPKLMEGKGMNVLGIIVFALFFGGTIGQIGHQGKPLKKFFNAFEIVIMRLVSMAIWTCPVGIFCLISEAIAQMEDLNTEVKRLGMFVLTVMIGLAIHFCITLQIIVVTLGRHNPIKFLGAVLQAMMTAFATASSNATMPLTLKCLEENVKADKRVIKFLVPLGATINMNGTALYEAVASIYIAQCLGLELTVGRVIIISFTSVLASVGASGMPHAGMITMIMVLIAIGLPPDYFALVVPVDWFIDRFRTAVNVFDDMVACIVVERMCKKQLQKMDDLDGYANEADAEKATKIIGQNSNGFYPMTEKQAEKRESVSTIVVSDSHF